MSKESYIRGFCKAAEAHGVDPQELVKFAHQNKISWKMPPASIVSQEMIPTPEHKTDGYAPDGVAMLGNKGIPAYYPPAFVYRNGETVLKPSATYDIKDLPRTEALQDIALSTSHEGEVFNRMLELSPKTKAWWNAHKKSLGKVDDTIRTIYPGIRKGSHRWDPNLSDVLRQIYHGSMMSLTGTPTRVSAPVRK